MTLGLVVVEVCDRNSLSSLSLEDLEADDPEVAVLRTNCLLTCNLCRAVPYAMVNGKNVYAKTKLQCLDLVKKAVTEEIKAFWDD